MNKPTKITIAKGDGIGPEIMNATLRVLKAANANLEIEEIEIGESVYKRGHSSGIAAEAWDTIRRNKVLLKAPITTPQGGGYKSLNVTMRKALGLYANIRPCRSMHPFVATKHPEMDIVIVRENEEDLYAGIEHRQTNEVMQCLKLITRPGCEKIIRYAFEYTKAHGRKKVTCFTKDNIMKQTDGLFHKVFDEIAPQYPEIESEHWIIDIGTARLADTPEMFDVIVTPNLYGDVISDVAAQIAGSVGLAGSANIGEECAMFEAIHGSAPQIAGQGIANPSGLINGAIQMLQHLGMGATAAKIQNAWLKTIEEGIHTFDIYNEQSSTARVSTAEFASAVIERLGQTPETLSPAKQDGITSITLPGYVRQRANKKDLLGVDVFVDWEGYEPDKLANALQEIQGDQMKLSMITNRGIKVWPHGFKETFCTDHWRCRFESNDSQVLDKKSILNLLSAAEDSQIDTIKTENLYSFDGERGFSLGQGQ